MSGRPDDGGSDPTTSDRRRRETDAERYLQYANYLWLLVAGFGAMVALSVSRSDATAAVLVFGAVVVGPLTVYYGLRRRSKFGWTAHMCLSLVALGSFVGILGLIFGWMGRNAVGIGATGRERRHTGDVTDDPQRPAPSVPTDGPSPSYSADDGRGDTEYWGVDDETDDERSAWSTADE
jgi:hypothetical protein